MSLPRPDLITDTDIVIKTFLLRINEIYPHKDIIGVFLFGSRAVPYKQMLLNDIHTNNTPSQHGDVDLFVKVSSELTDNQRIDLSQMINGFFRYMYKCYVCVHFGNEEPKQSINVSNF